jgi:putative oxidoreductase
MIYRLLQTDPDYVYLLLRVVAGIIIFPHGMQKLLGWFDDLGGGLGPHEVMIRMKAKNIPAAIAWLVIVGQSIGSIALILGCFGRFAAGANFIIFTGALIAHSHDGWAMNWSGKKRGEGIEYFVLLLSILAIITFKGSGPLSIDRWILTTL